MGRWGDPRRRRLDETAREPSAWFVRYHENRFLYLKKWYPHAWRIYAAVWMGRAWMHVVLWRAPGRSFTPAG